MPLDPESRARPLTWAGGLLAFAGLYSLEPWGWGVAALGFALLLLGCYSRRDGLLLLGPYFSVEARREARKGRAHLKRFLAVAIVGGIVVSVLTDTNWGMRDLGRPATRWEFARLAGTLMAWFGLALPFAVALLAATGVSGVVAEERANRRWEVLLSTDLRSREIVLGKLLGRAFGVLTLVAGLLPIVFLLGVSGLLPMAAILPWAVVVAGTILAVAGLCAGYGRAGLGLAALYLFGSSTLISLTFGGWWNQPLVPEVVQLLNAANPFTTAFFLMGFAPGDDKLLAILPDVARRFAAGSLVMFLWGVAVACRKLRADHSARVPLARRAGRLAGKLLAPANRQRVPQPHRVAPPRPPVTDEPVRWWTMVRVGVWSSKPERPATWFECGIAFLIALAVFIGCRVLGGAMDRFFGRPAVDPSSDVFAVWVGLIVGAVAGLGLLGVVRRAATVIPAERNGETLDALRLSDLTPGEVVRQAHAGSVARFRRLYWLLAMVPLAAVMTGFLPPLPVILAALVVGRFAAPTLASWALALSARATTPTRGMRNAVGGFLGAHYMAMIVLAGGAALVDEVFLKVNYSYSYRARFFNRSVEEVLWWDWLADPSVAKWNDQMPTYNLGRNGPKGTAGRIPWPYGPVIGLALAVWLVYAYIWFGKILRRVAGLRLARDWLPGPLTRRADSPL